MAKLHLENNFLGDSQRMIIEENGKMKMVQFPKGCTAKEIGMALENLANEYTGSVDRYVSLSKEFDQLLSDHIELMGIKKQNAA